jgi:hypothetical protein
MRPRYRPLQYRSSSIHEADKLIQPSNWNIEEETKSLPFTTYYLKWETFNPPNSIALIVKADTVQATRLCALSPQALTEIETRSTVYLFSLIQKHGHCYTIRCWQCGEGNRISGCSTSLPRLLKCPLSPTSTVPFLHIGDTISEMVPLFLKFHRQSRDDRTNTRSVRSSVSNFLALPGEIRNNI